MQIRLTVVDPQGPPPEARGRAASCDVLVTAPAGTALAAVASALAATVSDGPAVLYAGAERLDAQRRTLGEPPLVDGAVLAVGAPAEPEPHPEMDDAPARLDIVAGPDAGGVHLLHGGEVRIGRSADADVPLDDPDVSRLHCAVTLSADGQVTVADLNSTNGTTLDGTRVTTRPVRFTPGALLRIGESTLRLAPAGGLGARVGTVPDGEGCVRVAVGGDGGASVGAVAGGRDSDGRRPAGDAGSSVQASDVRGTSRGSGKGSTGASGGAGAPDQGPDTRGASPGSGRGGTQAPGDAGVPTQGPDTHGAAPGTGPSTTGADTHGASRDGGTWSRTSDTPARSQTSGAPSPSHDGAARSQTSGTSAPSHGTGTGFRSSGEPASSRDAATRSRTSGAPASPRDAGTRSPATDAPGTGTGTRPRASDAPGEPPISHGPVGWDTAGAPVAQEHDRGEAPVVPGQGRAPWVESRGEGPAGPGSGGDTHAGRQGIGPLDRNAPHEAHEAHDPPVGGPTSSRKGTPLRGTDVPPGVRRRGGIGAWARRLTGGRGGEQGGGVEHDGRGAAAGAPPTAPSAVATHQPETWPDPAALLLTALGPGPRLWERGPGHPEALTVRLGTADRTLPDGSGLLPAVPVTADLREAGALGLAGPRPRLAGLARAVLAQLAALHSPDALEIVLISADRSRPEPERTAEWSWLGWLPQLRPGHGQDCRLLLAHDREQAMARADELLRRLDDHLTTAPVPAPRAADATARPRPSWAREEDAPDTFAGPHTVVVVDGDPGGADLREAMTRLAVAGPRAGIHVVCLAETPPASPSSPVTETYEAACAVSPVFRECGAVALLSGDVATALRLLRVPRASTGAASGPVGHGTVGTVDAVSLAWAERFARALAPLRPDGPPGERHARVSAPLPQAARLLDELGLARATPASLMARWADAADDTDALGGRAWAVLGAGPRGPVHADLVSDGPHLLVEGPPGSGRTESLRAVVASLAAAERPDRLGVVLIDGRDGVGTGAAHGEGLRVCADVPHVTTHLTANDPVRMREFAQSLTAELKRRAELLGRLDFAEWHESRALSGRMVAQRTATAGGAAPVPAPAPAAGAGAGAGDLDTPPSSTLRLRPGGARRRETAETPPLPRLVVVVDDLDALVSPALGSPGRPAAGSVVRALEAVAREGQRLGVHLVAATGPCARTAETELARRATLRVLLDPPPAGPDEPAPGRGRLVTADGRATPFQGGRVTGRIPRTATLRPTVVPLEWQRMGDPPTRRPVRELGNGPTDLALLASALERAARQVAAAEVPSLL
ncbi:FHA domain-containing protein [Streptomyces sp. B93]|uniref:FHA domain-containing protein n=1 Tax=Streptomyces sp. B93 TaxID=2824875 RepID=UPI001B373FC5|nr:FHA domain-containing protein [Streptomyces sp. B93]MBQ1092926.1 FHA domain-containing protein [Streptomyces sp. B93]